MYHLQSEVFASLVDIWANFSFQGKKIQIIKKVIWKIWNMESFFRDPEIPEACVPWIFAPCIK